MKHLHWSTYKEELIATAAVVALAAGGSFFLAHQYIDSDQNSKKEGLILVRTLETESEVLGETDQSVDQTNLPPSPIPSPTTTPSPSPTPKPSIVEVPFGYGGTHDHPEYRITFDTPRLVIDPEDNNSRKFSVDIRLENLSTDINLPTRLTASVIKDGQVIVPTAAMSVLGIQELAPGEGLDYTATLTLIESTDVGDLLYRPGNDLPETNHQLNP